MICPRGPAGRSNKTGNNNPPLSSRTTDMTPTPLGPLITAIIRKTKSHTTLNLTDEELVLLALSDSAEKWVSSKTIAEFILGAIPFYASAVVNHVHEGAAGHALWDLNRKMESYLRTYGTPVHSKLQVNGKKFLYRITSGAAYHFVKRCHDLHVAKISVPQAPKNAPCHLMKLSPELRLAVFHLLLKVDGFRLMLHRGLRRVSLHEQSLPAWERTQKPLALSRTSQMMSILSVNKEIRAEALLELYAGNSFEFVCLAGLRDFLKMIGPDSRKYVRQVAFPYVNISAAAAGAKLLMESDTLQKLTILMSVHQDSTTGHYNINVSSRSFPTMTSIPGFNSLKRLRGIRELNFHADMEHTLLDNFLRPLVTQPRVSEKRKVKRVKKVKVNQHAKGSTEPDNQTLPSNAIV